MTKQGKRMIAYLTAIMLLFWAGVGSVSFAQQTPAKPRVVTTIFPPYDFMRQITDGQAELSMLLPLGSESHSFEPTPRDILTIQNCDVFVYTGGEGDAWVERILSSMDLSGKTVLRMVDMVKAVEEEQVEGMQDDEEHDAEQGEGHGEPHDQGEGEALDEHVWTAPQNAALIVNALAEAMAEIDPSNQALYRQNAAAYVGKLAALDQAFRETVNASVRKTLVFGDRFPFRYLADAYGLAYYAAFPGCANETEASAATLRFLIDKVREMGIPVVFHIELSNEKICDVVCESTGAQKRTLHSGHNVTRKDFDAGIGYLDIMEKNLATLKEALN